jgi:uncharacterized protein YdaU (DUF1376 family)
MVDQVLVLFPVCAARARDRDLFSRGWSMNYWRRFAGDYQRDTGHLSLTEHGAYTMLLDHYYSKRCPLPVGLEALCRLCRATTRLERNAVKAVADEFFKRAADGRRHNPRADREIAAWERQAQINRERGKLGGRPKRIPDENPPANPGANPPGSFPETREVSKAQPAAKALQLQLQNPTPDPESEPEPEPPPAPGGAQDSRPQPWAAKEFHDAVIAAYHEELPDLPRVKMWSKARSQALTARIRERLKEGRPSDTLDYWRQLFGQVAKSDFLCGRSKDFRADLEWILNPKNFVKIIEGRYENRRSNGDAHAR